MSILRQRIATALVLGSVTVAGVLWLPMMWFACSLAVVMLIAAWEWAAFVGLSRPLERLVYSACLLLWLIVLWVWIPHLWYPWLLIPSVLIWLWIALFLWRSRQIVLVQHRELALAGLGIIVFSAPVMALIILRDYGSQFVLFFLVLLWLADSVAYFTGKRWGRHKLAPLLSPGKTLEGMYGALVAGLLWAGVFVWIIISTHYWFSTWLVVAFLCLLTVLFSILGDLYESFLKRRRDMKDSGALLPGHGGLLDRIDSLLAAAPVFALGMIWLAANQWRPFSV
jgi:phosphatidate cytidylyltransferase